MSELITPNLKRIVPNDGPLLRQAGVLLRREVIDPNTKRKAWGLEIQAFDAYGYQRELTIARYREPGASHPTAEYEVVAYRHPFRPPIHTLISPAVARRLISRIVELTEQWPSLLWNDANERYAQHAGFVRFHDWLLYGSAPSVRLLP